MPPDIAGVTLFAFASGAPDLFTQISAVAKGAHVDLDLAVSATFGGGLFIVCVVFSAVVLVAPGGHVEIPVRARGWRGPIWMDGWMRSGRGPGGERRPRWRLRPGTLPRWIAWRGAA